MLATQAIIAVLTVLPGGAASADESDGREQCGKLVAQYWPGDKVPWGDPAVVAAFQGACDAGGCSVRSTRLRLLRWRRR